MYMYVVAVLMPFHTQKTVSNNNNIMKKTCVLAWACTCKGSLNT